MSYCRKKILLLQELISFSVMKVSFYQQSSFYAINTRHR